MYFYGIVFVIKLNNIKYILEQPFYNFKVKIINKINGDCVDTVYIDYFVMLIIVSFSILAIVGYFKDVK